MKIMLSAGEASGDLHGADIARALKKLSPDIKLLGMGGAAMREAGVDVRFDIAEHNVMGIVEVLKNLRSLFALRDAMVKTMLEEEVDLFVTIDYPDFNMRVAEKAKAAQIPVFSYIPPSAWAWRQGRAQKVARLADKIAAIFPFETAVYEAAGADITFVGNPLLDAVKPSMDEAAARSFFQVPNGRRVVLLLPGSRPQEIRKLLPVMLEAAEGLQRDCAQYAFYLPLASTIAHELIQDLLDSAAVDVKVTSERRYDLMYIADTAIASSGTVTLEAALLGLPSVVIYKMAPLTYYIGRLLVKLENFSLPNIIAGERVLPELLQNEVTAANIVQAVKQIETTAADGTAVREKLAFIKERLGQPGAAMRAAQLMLETALAKRRGGRSS